MFETNRSIDKLTPVEQANAIVNAASEAGVRQLVERIYQLRDSFDLSEVFLSAVDLEEVMRYGLKRLELDVLKYMPDVIKALADKAKRGDVPAARALLEVIGAIGSGRNTTTVANQINITTQELRELERDLYGKE